MLARRPCTDLPLCFAFESKGCGGTERTQQGEKYREAQGDVRPMFRCCCMADSVPHGVYRPCSFPGCDDMACMDAGVHIMEMSSRITCNEYHPFSPHLLFLLLFLIPPLLLNIINNNVNVACNKQQQANMNNKKQKRMKIIASSRVLGSSKWRHCKIIIGIEV